LKNPKEDQFLLSGHMKKMASVKNKNPSRERRICRCHMGYT